jgi:hypothetical protein
MMSKALKTNIFRAFYELNSTYINHFLFDCVRLLFRSMEIIWNLLENGDKTKLVTQMNSLLAIGQLRDAFLKQLLQGYSNYDRQLRQLLFILKMKQKSLPFRRKI